MRRNFLANISNSVLVNLPLVQMEVHNYFNFPPPLSTIKKKESGRKEIDRVLRLEIGHVNRQCRHSGHPKQWLMD